jgi:hypothetical protein
MIGLLAIMSDDHLRRRESRLGRWFPAAAYLTNYLLCVIAVIWARAFDLLWLAVLPLPALVLYLARTSRR